VDHLALAEALDAEDLVVRLELLVGVDLRLLVTLDEADDLAGLVLAKS